jgi:hypothetical protein
MSPNLYMVTRNFMPALGHLVGIAGINNLTTITMVRRVSMMAKMVTKSRWYWMER